MSQPKPTTEQLWGTTHLGSESAAYLEALFESYIADPDSVDSAWRDYFDGLPSVSGSADISHAQVRAYFASLVRSSTAGDNYQTADLSQARKQASVAALVAAYRSLGHQVAHTNPLTAAPPSAINALDYRFHGLSDADLDSTFYVDSDSETTKNTLATIVQNMRTIYCHRVGLEYTHITDSEEKAWMQSEIERRFLHTQNPKDKRQTIYRKLAAAEGLERYLHTKYVGQKRFSLEGGESLIPLLHELIQHAGQRGIKEIGIGMAHRGRLNVLVNILGKIPRELFDEFEGAQQTDQAQKFSGDVKYHQGFSSDVSTPGGDVHLALAFNPSHLEIVSPVVQGSARARQERRTDTARNQVLPVLIHGDSAFAGQGVVMETFSMSQARGYTTGGSVHVIVNNQVGFTTSNPEDTRSTPYCSDVAKMVQCPIFHVNADDPDAAIITVGIALDYRMRFNKDVVIDLVCYRRHGHNEADEPSATQPMMYQIIKRQATTRERYAAQLVADGVFTTDDIQAISDGFRQRFEQGDGMVDELQPTCTNEFAVDWTPYLDHNWTDSAETGFDLSTLQALAKQLFTLPDDFSLQPQVKRVYADRLKMAAGEHPLDWGFAETLAYATLLKQGYPIRLSGQDSGRGTFAHRHAVLHDQKTGEAYIPLMHIHEKQPNFLVIDSLLSEEAVLGFEYGYATAEPKALVLWEAQFGDFANGAQVVIDQFISSGEQKWRRLCGLTMLLPHGYEGMGPEHSSARLERYLQLCAEHNMQVCVPSTPAQCYHMLRRQAIRPYRKPLIVMSPKSLLRHKSATSTLDALVHGEFQPVLPDSDGVPSQCQRVILCSGKVYYDLLAEKHAQNNASVALLRLEQLYPFPKESLLRVLADYQKVTDFIWCQEEPRNQGAWFCILHDLQTAIPKGASLRYVGRASSASPAVGYAGLHKQQQAALVNEALTGTHK